MIIAGMAIKLSNPGPAVAIAPPVWNHRGARSLNRPSRLPKVQWHDFEEDPEIPTTSSTSSPVLSQATSMHANKSTGTLNTSIVI